MTMIKRFFQETVKCSCSARKAGMSIQEATGAPVARELLAITQPTVNTQLPAVQHSKTNTFDPNGILHFAHPLDTCDLETL